MTDPPPVALEFVVPDEWELGAYANTLNVWHSPYEFALDWAVTSRPRPADPDDASAGIAITANVVARVRIPVALIFDAVRALNDAMTGYEYVFGEIRRPEPRERPDTREHRDDDDSS